jgi:mannose-1-phosphate guanylyltransferase
MSSAAPPPHAIILAGGRGTRFWPRSRTRSPKQLLNIVGQKTMLEQTYERLAPLFPNSQIWVVTHREQARAVSRQLRRVPSRHILTEPVGRNTAAAIGLAAVHLLRQEKGGDALMAVLPADHFIGKPARYRQIVPAALKVAAQPEALVVLGIPPPRIVIMPTRLAGSPKSRLSNWPASTSRPAVICGMRGCFSGACPRFSKISSAICPKPMPP